MRLTRTLAAILAIAACGASGAALADNPVGFYVGAGAGTSQNRSDDSRYGYPGYYNDYQFAWQGIIGIRPISLLGLEAEYIDFGQPYLPFLDIFAKAGVARLSTNVTDFVAVACVINSPCPNFMPTDRHQVTDTRFAYGAGVQSKFPFGLILRGEYERISSQFGDPDALMVSAVWQF